MGPPPTRRRRAPARQALIVTGPDDAHAVAVAVHLAPLGLEPVRVELAALPGLGLSVALGGGRPARALLGQAGGPAIDPGACAAAWWRRPRPPLPAGQLGEAAARLWTAEWTAALRGLARVVGGRWVNDPARDEVAALKLVQLEAARAVGLPVPRTLVTNDLAAAGRFIRGCRRGAVAKSLGSTKEGGYTRGVRQGEAWLAGRLAGGPAILQERVEGLDLRVTAVGRRLFAMSADARAGGDPDDVRADWWKAAATARAETLPAALERGLLALVRRLGLRYAAIDLRRTRGGGYAFLEVNPEGQWLHAEAATGHPITAAVARLLAGRAGG